MNIFFLRDKLSVTLCLEYINTYLFRPSTSLPPPPLHI